MYLVSPSHGIRNRTRLQAHRDGRAGGQCVVVANSEDDFLLEGNLPLSVCEQPILSSESSDRGSIPLNVNRLFNRVFIEVCILWY